MNKLLKVLLSVLLTFSLIGCSSKSTSDSSKTSEDTKEEDTTSEEDQLKEDEEELAAFGEVEVEKGIVFVYITLPSDFVGDVTQEQLDASAGTTYTSATLNEDGTATYKFTKAQHKAMLESISNSLDESIQEMINSEDYTITNVEHNDSFTEFDVTVSGSELGLSDAFGSLVFMMSGGMYGIFNGTSDQNVIVNYYSNDGTLIDSYNSADQ